MNGSTMSPSRRWIAAVLLLAVFTALAGCASYAPGPGAAVC